MLSYGNMLSSNSNANANLEGITLSIPTLYTWIIDMSATNHMCSLLSLLSSYKPCISTFFVQLLGGTHSQVTIPALRLSTPLYYC